MLRYLKKVLGTVFIGVGIIYVSLSVIAKKKKAESVFENDIEQKNPFEGKKVVFVEDENDKENADGVRGHLEVIGVSDYKYSFYEKYTKRGIDLLLSFGGLVALSPIMAAIALAIKIEDPGPVLFTQKRTGQNKKYFKLHKFRSMKMCTPHDVPTHMLDNPDQYITKVGKFLRAHSLDELPQIWDIFIGNMSVIGPRPGLWNQDVLIAERDKYCANVVKPGLTGLAQINGRDELEIPEKAKLDGEYCRNISLKMDAKVFMKSLGVFSGDDSVVEGGTGEINKNIKGKLNMNNPMVSVVVATYRRDVALRNALQSLALQTYNNYEVILVDDNGDDEWNRKVSEIVKDFSNLNLQVIVNNPNKGSAQARNEGIMAAKGEYITFLDDDDVYLPKKIEKQVRCISEKDADFCITDLFLYNESDKQTDKRIRNYIQETDQNSLLTYHLMYHMTGTDTLMFKTTFLQQIGGFAPIDVGDEFYLVLRAIVNGCKFSYLPGCDVKAYVHNENGGLSTGMHKIKGENDLYKKKKLYFGQLSNKAIRFIIMRHYAVLGVAYKRSGKYGYMFLNLFKSIMATPVGFLKLLSSHKG